ncbi:MAG: diadenylate cyclase, partial [Planctomycetota bacterium]|nr:diadenylate cyclase [Planctomycetota bacterium]
APAQGVDLRQGLGARHYSAAAITKATKAVAIAVSESSGGLTVFKSGTVLIEIEKPTERRKQTSARLPQTPPAKQSKGN